MFERLIDNNEIIKSLKESLEDRTTSPIYGVFIISWMVVHWKFLYTALFVSEDKIWQTEMLLKSDYLSLTFFDFNSLDFYILLILPFFLTWILIWKIPQWVSIKAYEEAQINERKKNEIKLKTKSLLLKGQLEILELTDQNKEKEVKIIQKEEEINKIDPTAEWSKEFKEIVTKNGHLISAIEFGKKIVFSKFLLNANACSITPLVFETISCSASSWHGTLISSKISGARTDKIENCSQAL